MWRSFLMAVSLIFIIVVSAFSQDYVIIGWNDLGMHCANRDFSKLVVLPPYNNIHAQVIRVGDAINLPQVVTDSLHVTYEIPGNTYSVGKSNFWSYDLQLFGVDLPDNIGLTGNGLSGDMTVQQNYFMVTGVPLTPFTDIDLINEDPFQLGLLKLYDQNDQLLATAQPVVPVSNEINCVGSGCHSSEQGILNQHAGEAGFDPNNTPILCASCHASNALGAPGIPDVPSLSQAVHEHHGGVTNDCYKCHPGPTTQCLRDVMNTQYGVVCQDCHGSVTQVGQSIDGGRDPWFEEPSCGASQCHGSQFAEEPGKLFRESRGHGGLFCSVCHGEPHAVVPSRENRDNLQFIALQGHSGTLSDCTVCHGVIPSGAGPHGIQSGGDCNYIVGDVNGSGNYNGLDITYGVAFLKGGNAPLCDACSLCSDWHYCGDVNGSCNYNGLDVTYGVNFLKGIGPDPVACGDCPPAPRSLAIKPEQKPDK